MMLLLLAILANALDCENRVYCVRHRYITNAIYLQQHPPMVFRVESIEQKHSSVVLQLHSSQWSYYLSQDVQFQLEFYDQGLVMHMTQLDTFVYDTNPNLLEKAEFQLSSNTTHSTIQLEKAKYVIHSDFKIDQYFLYDQEYVQGITINPIGSMIIERSPIAQTQHFEYLENKQGLYNFLSHYWIGDWILQLMSNDYIDPLVLHANWQWNHRNIPSKDFWDYSTVFNMYSAKVNSSRWDQKIYQDAREYVSVGFKMSKDLFGLPERADSHKLKETRFDDPYSLLNKDRFPHDSSNQKYGLYASIPFIMSLHNNFTTGLLWQNPAETWVDIWPLDEGELVQFMSKSGAINFYIFGGATPYQVSHQLNSLTGRAPIPNILSLGFHYSSWDDFASAQLMIDRLNNFTSNGFPVDYLWLDLPYTQEGNYFIFNPKGFPQSKRTEMEQLIENSGRRLVIIADPHVKNTNLTEHQSFILLEGLDLEDLDKQIFVKTYDGQYFVGHCWPGTSIWLDFLSPDTQTFWKQIISDHLKPIYDLWIDMNEPAVFESLGLAMPDSNKMFNGVRYSQIHNAYGLEMQKASFEALKFRETRPFLLSRATFTGGQQYGALWTGDNQATQEDLIGTIPTILALSIAGFSFVGADIPGFHGDPSDSLIMQFYQLGVWLPFMRAHNHIDTPDREPWLQSEEVQKVIKNAIWLRYTFIHYLMTQFWINQQYGEPIVRPLWFDFPSLKDIEDQFMFGRDIMIVPKLQHHHQHYTEVILPQDQIWYDYNTKQIFENCQIYHCGWNIQAIFIKSGSIIPILLHNNDLTLTAALNNTIRLEIYGKKASGLLYLDGNKNNDQKLVIKLTYQDSKLSSQFIHNDYITEAYISEIFYVDEKVTQTKGLHLKLNMEIAV